METPASRFRQVLGEQLAESLRTPPPPHTARRVHGRVRFPGKATAVIGMRRAGKTTFLHQIRGEVEAGRGSLALAPYLSFEDERLIGLTASDLGFVLDEHIRLLPAEEADAGVVVWCFDEIQLVAGWERFVRRLLDERRSEVFVSGSSAALLSREIATSLRGRAWPVLMHPFSFEEACRHRRIPIPERLELLSRRERLRLERAFRDWLRAGGFPEAQGLDGPSRHQLLRDYVDVAILRDVVERHRVSNVTGLRWLARHLLGNAGGLFSVEKFHARLKSQGHRHREGYGASVARPSGRLLPGARGVDGVELRTPAHGQPAQGVSRRPGSHPGVRPQRSCEPWPRPRDRRPDRARKAAPRRDLCPHAPGLRGGLPRPRRGPSPGTPPGLRRPFGCSGRTTRAARAPGGGRAVPGRRQNGC